MNGVLKACAAFLLSAAFLCAASADATVVPRLAGVESPTASPYDFDQVGTRCEASSAVRDTSLAYAGSASLKVHTEDDAACGGPYARGIFQTNTPYHLVQGDDFWFGAAIYLPAGFYSAHTSYTDLIRIDSYVKDDSTDTPFEDRAEINFASWDNDDLYVRAARGATARKLFGPISPTQLPEGKWNWVEIHVELNSEEHWAATELKINGVSQGETHAANLFEGAAPLNRLRYGIVSTGTSGSGNLTAYFDRASISPTERTPTPSASESRVSLWRLNEASGSTAPDTMGAAPGTYVNEPTLGVSGIVGSRVDAAASFDGSNDHVAITPTAPLNMKGGLTLEAWAKADALQGSVIRRNNSYELRPQSDGSVLFRVWVNGTLQSLTSATGLVSAGSIHHLVGTYDGANMRIYVNGSQVASRSQTGSISHSGGTLYIGRNDGSSTYFDGVIDEVAIHSEALSAGTVLDHFEEGEYLDQVSNPSATTNLSGWSTPSLGTFSRSTASFYSAPASFMLQYSASLNKAYEPVVTTVSDPVETALEAGRPYIFRFQSRKGSGDLFAPTGGCIRLYLSGGGQSTHCAPQDDDKTWQSRAVSFKPSADVEAYQAEFSLWPESFLGWATASMHFDNVELVAAG
jgi:hypothetical protein